MTDLTTDPGPLDRWYEAIETFDPAKLPALIAPDGVFRSPALFNPAEGRDQVVLYLTAAFHVLQNGFRYDRTWVNPTNAVLEFRTVVDEREIHGIDMIQWDEDGLISDFTVMIRPLSALNTVIEHMAAKLGELGAFD